MANLAKIACIGEVMVELIAGRKGQAAIGVGGDTYNTAVYIKQLANQANIDITYITALGKDRFSNRIVQEIKRHGLLASHIEYRDGQMPGLYAIDTDEHGERSFAYWRGQSAARTLFQAPCQITLKSLLAFDLLYISGISMAILPPTTRLALFDFLKEFRASGGKLAFDSNYRPHLWEDIPTAQEVTMIMWSLSDIALPSLDDEMLLFNENDEAAVLQRLKSAGVTYGALKRGIEGPLGIGEVTGKAVFESITNVVDTTAAGDSFNAGFLYQHAMGSSLAEAMLSGHWLASKVIQASGAIIEFDEIFTTKGARPWPRKQ